MFSVIMSLAATAAKNFGQAGECARSNHCALLMRGPLGTIKIDQRLVPALAARPGRTHWGQTVPTTRCGFALAQVECARPDHAGPSFLISPYAKMNSQMSAMMLSIREKK